MNKKKILKALAVFAIFVLALLIGVPFFLEAKIGPILKRKVNAQITGDFDFRDAQLSLIRNFPNASVALEDLVLTTKEPFAGDTLISAREASLVMSIAELFKGEGEPIGIQELVIRGADLRLVSDAEERVNYLIANPEEPTPDTENDAQGFSFNLQQYGIEDSRVSYRDAASGIAFVLDSIWHSGSGDLSLAESQLETFTEARISFAMDSVAYLNRNTLQLEALIGIDLEEDRYSFLENLAHVNQMPLVFDGSVTLVEDGQDIDLNFQTPNSAFENFLALIPETYTKDLREATSSGQFRLEGRVQGRLDDNRIPAFEIGMQAEDASFRYPDLPRGVDDIHFTATLANTTGNTADTFLEIPDAAFRIDQDTFAANARIANVTDNPAVDASLRGRLDLAKLDQAYPVDIASGMRGILEADITTAFDMQAVADKRYQDTRTAGTLSVTDFAMMTENFQEPLKIERANLRFDPVALRLETLNGSLGKSDFGLSGTLRGYLGYLLGEGKLQGELVLTSNQLHVADFTTPGQDGQGPDDSGASGFEIPEDVELGIRGQAASVYYDDLPLRNVRGVLQIADRQVRLQEVRSDALDGKLVLDGMLSTQGEKPRFSMNLGIDGFRIRETLEAIELFETLAPIAAIVQGRLNSKVNLSGLLKDDFSPEPMSLAGNAVAEVLAGEVTGTKAQVLQALDSKLDFFDASNLNLKGLKTALNFENGLVQVKPFNFSYRDVAIEVRGSHTFDQQLDYTATLQVPAKYLGKEVNRLMSELAEPELQSTTIPVVARIGGSYLQPTVETDLKAAVSDLSSRLIEVQKQKLAAAGKKKATDLLGNLLDTPSDSTKTASDSARTGVKSVLSGVLAGRPKDSTSAAGDTTGSGGGAVEKAARNILGGLLGRKKDTTSVRKDSVQQ